MQLRKPKPLQSFLILMGVSLLLILFTGSEFFYNILLVIILLPLVLFLLLQHNASKIIQNISIKSQEVIKGDLLEVKLLSRNDALLSIAHGHLECSLENKRQKIYLPNFKQSFLPSIMLQQKADFEMHTRGIFTTVLIKTEVRDPLNLFKKTFEHRRPIDLTVYPKIYDLDYFHLPHLGHQGTRKSLRFGQEDYANLKKVRPYNVGDSTKRIHWKLSSKREDIFIKEYESTSNSKAYILLNANTHDYRLDEDSAIEDTCVEIAGSISKYALRKNTETMLIYENNGILKFESRDLSNFQYLLKALVAFGSYGQLSFSELIHQESKKMEQGAFITLVTPNFSQDLMHTLLGLRQRKFYISLIVVGKEPLKKGEKDFIEAMGIHFYEASPEISIKQVLETYK